MPDIKKLISGFLFFSVLATLFSFGTSSFLDYLRSEATPSLSTSKSAAPENAFTSKTQSLSPSASLNSGHASSTNLTRRLGNILAGEVIRVNDAVGTLNGPANGLTSPNRTTLETLITQNLVDAPALLKELPEFPESVNEKELSLISNPNEQDFAQYIATTEDVLNRTILSNDFENLQKKSASLEAIYAGVTVYRSATQALLKASVPQPLLEFHKKLLTLVSNQKKMVDVALGEPDDPLKSIAIIKEVEKQAEGVLFRDMQNLARETELLDLSSLSPQTQLSLLERLLGIKQAFAQGSRVPVLDATLNKIAAKLTGNEVADDKKNWLQRLWDLAQKVFLQELKNQLIAMLQQQIVSWINGGGKPQFVTDWKGFLSNAFNNAAGAVIEKLIPELCYPSELGAFLRISIQAPGVTVPVYTGCTLNQVVSNIKNFYSNFHAGGWIQYGVTFQPTGNFFGIMIEGHDRVTREAIAAAEAAKNKALAGSGFLSTEICPSTGKPPGQDKDGNPRPYGPMPDGSNLADGCPGGEQPIVRTPGKVLGDTLTKSLSLPADTIINANDIAGLIAVAADAALTRLITSGVSAINGQPTGSGLSQVSYGRGGTVTVTDCSALTGQALQECNIQKEVTECDTGRKSGSTCDTAREQMEALLDERNCKNFSGQNLQECKLRNQVTVQCTVKSQACTNARKQLETLQSVRFGVAGIVSESRKTSGAETVPDDIYFPEEGDILLSGLEDLEAQNPKVNLYDATTGQNHTYKDRFASEAVDGTLDSYSDNYGGDNNPGWWEVTLFAPEYLNEVKYVKYLSEEKFTLKPYSIVGAQTGTQAGPFLVLFEGDENTRYEIDLTDNSEADKKVNLSQETAMKKTYRGPGSRNDPRNWTNVGNIKANTVKTTKVRFEAQRIVFREVELFRHLRPVIDVSKVPASFTKKQATNINPLLPQWVTAKAYPYYNNPQPADQSKIQVKIEDSARNTIKPLNPTSSLYTLPPGTYRLTYTLEVDGVAATPRVRTLTVQQ
ncbi:MAG: hypothetical protein FJY98_00960 [Candidatus Liptonbacteria bacterium]|nr:hypothetical protein [Candidatus Liptonbacteria bacterium]